MIKIILATSNPHKLEEINAINKNKNIVFDVVKGNFDPDETGKNFVENAEIKAKDFNPEDYIEPKEAKRMDRVTQFAIVAADEAIADSGIDEANIDPYRIGVIVSSAAGGFKTFE